MTDLLRCKQQIQTLYRADSTALDSFSKLTTRAWGQEKAFCMEQFQNSPTKVKEFLEGKIAPLSNSDHNSSQTTSDDTQQQIEKYLSGTQTKINKVVEQPSVSWFHFDWKQTSFEQLGRQLLWFVIGVIFVISLWKLIRYLFVFSYDVLHAKRIIWMRLMQPRGDSKLDREREKELAKDMKEKIGRMSQVYRGIHKRSMLSLWDNIISWMFHKYKVQFVMHYEKGQLALLVGCYPEHKKNIEGAIAAQYPEVSIEPVTAPIVFGKKNYELMPMQPVKPTYYPIRVFKQLEDDPLNNIYDSLSKINSEDTFSIIITVKTAPDSFNKEAQRIANALYKKDDAVLQGVPLWKKLLPWNFFKFLISGPSEALINQFAGDKKGGDPMIRMVKAEEEAVNMMAEEAGKQAFEAGLFLVSSSDDDVRVHDNLSLMMTAYSIYKDEYNNELEQPELLADIFGMIFEPLWRFAIQCGLVNFIYKMNIFTIDAMASLYHLPDAVFNRSQIIKWMDYKALPCPENVVMPKEENGFIISGKLADTYMDGDFSAIAATLKHPCIGSKEVEEDKKEEVAADYVAKEGEEIRQEADGKRYKITKIKKTVHGMKLYKDAICLGINIYRNQYTPIYMKRNDRTRHHYIIGKSGTGKSVFIDALARQDIWNGDGCCVVDPHGDLVESILNYVPKERAKDVIYFNAGDQERPMGLNLYEIDNIGQADRAVNDATEIFLKMFGPEIFGPRIQEYFKYGSLTLLDDMEDGATLLDVPRLFTDESYREYKTKKVKNPIVRNFWEKTYNAMGDREKQEIIPYFTSKFVSFNTNSLIRNIIGQTKSAFNFREVMDNRKILLINLSKGMIGELNAQLLGMIIVSKIYNAAMSRADIPEADRKDFYLYVDEFQNFVTDAFADILSEARKYKLALIMAHQYIAQLEGGKGGEGSKKSVKDAVFGNVGTMMSFKVGAPDAEFLEKEYAPVLSSQDIIGIANYKTYLKLNINNTTSRVFSINSIYTKDYESKKIGEILREYSAKKYGRKKEFVDAEITARLGMMTEEEGEQVEGAIDASADPTSTPEATPENDQQQVVDTPAPATPTNVVAE